MIAEMESQEFNESFWVWFDSLPPEEKTKFNYYKSDMAKLNFYNKVWSKNR